MDVVLCSGQTVKVADADPLDCQCGPDPCPYLGTNEWEAGPMERTRVTWYCSLVGEDFLWNKISGRFDSRRVGRCVERDPNAEELLPKLNESLEKAERFLVPYSMPSDYYRCG